MQYILTESEYAKLTEAVTVVNIEKKRILSELCTLIACTKPVKTWRSTTPEPWGCPHVEVLCDFEGDRDDDNKCTHNGCQCHDHFEYCDECPVQGRCPQQRYYSQ